MEDDKKARIVDARMKLRERFLARIQASPAVSDPRPMGSGPRNRHGMPRLPVGQTVTEKWPVLDLGIVPRIDLDRWRLTVDGAVEDPVTLRWEDLLALPQADEEADFHCVTGWSILDVTFRGVRLETLVALARPTADATHAMFHGADGYSTNLPLWEALKPDVLVVHTIDGQPLSRDHGGPARIVVPQLWAWKGAKWVNRIEFLTGDRRGYWEIRGYSNTAYPWRDDRMW